MVLLPIFIQGPHLLIKYSSLMNMEQQYERVFNHFDQNKDRKISAAELIRCVGRIRGGEVLSLAEAEAAVRLMDSDGDGLLCLEEFVKLVDELGVGEEKMSELREAFKMYEMDGNGFITPESLKRMLSKLGESKSMDECKLMIQSFDLNDDGVLHFDEFISMMSS